MKAVLSLLKDLEQEDTNNLIGRKCRLKTREKGTRMSGILTVVSIQRVWGYDEQCNYTMVDGCRVTNNKMKNDPLPSSPVALNEIEWI